ncbi:general substrate transporter [Aspergillus parasiticus]|uniref:General substrate transporter n=1 Tax=Aspergillus parasiticus TaxID=5067 RepID=A0A5N6D5I7_ASPPA|nr:general substrate transporter [Aspergillus parasiticus]
MAILKGEETELAVGSKLRAVLPQGSKPWYRTWHLVKLNLLLTVPLVSSASVGYDGSMMNGLQTLTQWRVAFNNPQGSLLGLVNAVYPLGKVVSLPLVAFLSDRFGRKVPLAVGLVACIGFSIMQGFANNFATFVTARALLGFSTSFLSQPSPILVAELSYPPHRGKVTALYNTFFYLGAIFASWCTYGTFRLESSWSWRIPSILQGAIPVLQLLGVFFLPESPRYLVSKGKLDKARAVFAEYHTGGDLDSPLVDFEMKEIQESLAAETAALSETSWLDLIRTPANRHRTLIAVIVGWFSQWNGVGVVSYYLTLVLDTIGITETKDQTLINGLLQIFNWLVAIFLGAMMIDRFGRRALFLTSTAGMLASYIIWTALSARFSMTKDEALGRAVVGFIFVYYLFYDIAWTPLLQAYPVEIFPYTLRGRGLTVSYIAGFVGLIVGNQANSSAMTNIGWKYYIVFCCLLALIWVLVWFLFPETKGYTLEEIAEIFEGKPENRSSDAKDGNSEKETGHKNAPSVNQIEHAC